MPDVAFVAAEERGESAEVLLRDRQPRRPDPFLVWASHADVDNEPRERGGTHVWVADAVQLPRAGDGEISGHQLIVLVLAREHDTSGGHDGDLDALVAVPVETPILVGGGLPGAHADKARQDIRCEELSRIRITIERIERERASCARLPQRRTGVGDELLARPVVHR